ncbi:MAG: RNA methyltransferase [bacterium]
MPKRTEQNFFIICDNLRSLYNVGSIFRTSDAMKVDKIFLCGITGTPEQKGLQKVALGAENSVAWEHVKNAWQLVDKLKKQGFQIVALEQTPSSVDIKRFKPKFPLVLIVGNEVNGVAPSLLKRSDACVEIAMNGMKESLNVSVAYGIASYALNGFRRLK